MSRLISNKSLPLSGKTTFSFCNSCPMGKSHKLSFSLSNSISSSPLELLHSDIWMSPYESNSGFKYYLIFIDDYSRYTWFFPMRLKFEVFAIFVKFKKYVENLLSCTIKILQTDERGEYKNKAFHDFLNKHGISFRFSCPKHPEQNSMAERKHRHIVETGLTMLAHSHMPQNFWDDAFHSALYLINMLSS